jgi:hypothetical protein
MFSELATANKTSLCDQDEKSQEADCYLAVLSAEILLDESVPAYVWNLLKYRSGLESPFQGP